MRKPQFSDNVQVQRSGILTENGLILHTNVVGNLIKPVF